MAPFLKWLGTYLARFRQARGGYMQLDVSLFRKIYQRMNLIESQLI